MATEVQTQPDYGMVNTETRLGEDTIAPGLISDLEQYYDKTPSYTDKAKALELLTALRLGESVQENVPKRPLTAMPTGLDHQQNFFSPYQTSYNKDYPLKQPIDTVAYRPSTSHGYPPQMGPVRETTYNVMHTGQMGRPITPLRPGTASGNRANNPHPREMFMVWKFPRSGMLEQEGSKWSEEVTDEKINQVHRRMCKSTYQNDYLGIPQGFQVRSAYNGPPDWKENIPFTLDSVQRYSYQPTEQSKSLRLPNTRYGSNKKKPLAASGTIPTASSRHLHIRSRTTYDRHYNDNADAVTQQIRDIGHKLGAEALKRYYEQAKGEDRQMARMMLEAYRGQRTNHTAMSISHPQPPAQDMYQPRPPSRPMSHTSKTRGRTPASTQVTSPYVPLPPAKDPTPDLQDAVYSPPNFLN